MKNTKQVQGWVGSTSYAQPQGKGDYPGAKCMVFWSIWTYNRYFVKNSTLMVIDVTYIPVLFGLWTKVVVMLTNQLSPEELADFNETSRDWEFAMAKRRAERQAIREKQEQEQQANRQEMERLSAVGAKYEARVKHMKALPPSEDQRKLLEQVLNAGDPEVLFPNPTDAYKAGFMMGQKLQGVKSDA